VGPRAVLDAVVKKKIPSARLESNLRSGVHETVGTGHQYTERQFTATYITFNLSTIVLDGI
jgi:hypothetical protein